MKKEIESAIAHAQAINATATAMESIIVLDIIQLLRQARNLAAQFEFARRDAIRAAETLNTEKIKDIMDALHAPSTYDSIGEALHAEFEESGRP